MTTELYLRDVLVFWKGDFNEPHRATIAVGEIENTEDYLYDNRIFYYCQNEAEYDAMFNRFNGEDFYFVKEQD
ncbi:MAG: hypothetical protein ACKOQ8_05620 [Micrococcales bacterium]